jgi:hypothetical protein
VTNVATPIPSKEAPRMKARPCRFFMVNVRSYKKRFVWRSRWLVQKGIPEN